jgi:hypothetical protein
MAWFSFPASIYRVGASNTGIRLVEFEVTPAWVGSLTLVSLEWRYEKILKY